MKPDPLTLNQRKAVVLLLLLVGCAFFVAAMQINALFAVVCTFCFVGAVDSYMTVKLRQAALTLDAFNKFLDIVRKENLIQAEGEGARIRWDHEGKKVVSVWGGARRYVDIPYSSFNPIDEGGLLFLTKPEGPYVLFLDRSIATNIVFEKGDTNLLEVE